jgi:hypothetical protein
MHRGPQKQAQTRPVTSFQEACDRSDGSGKSSTRRLLQVFQGCRVPRPAKQRAPSSVPTTVVQVKEDVGPNGGRWRWQRAEVAHQRRRIPHAHVNHLPSGHKHARPVPTILMIHRRVNEDPAKTISTH